VTRARRAVRVLLVAADKAVLFIGDRGRVERAYEFPAGDAGCASFARYLQAAPAVPTHVLIDVVEEEYRQDTIPHIQGRDRRAVLQRKYARLFRGTPYCLSLRQGREPEGRRDDRVLLTALTKPDVLTPWLNELTAHETPVVGVYSLPILSAALLPRLQAKAANVLLISVQRASGLRQTFFRDGHLKISRLAQMPRLGAVSYAQHVLAELAKLRRYLNSLALVSRDSPLAIYVLSHGDMLNELESQCRNSESEHYFLVDTAELSARLEIETTPDSPYADPLFAQLALLARPRENYAQRSETRYFRLYRARLGLVAAGLLLLVGSAGWSALRFVDAVGLRHQALDAAQKSDYYRARFDMARRDLPPTVVDPPAIETAVASVGALTARKASPAPWLELVSHELNAEPTISVEKIEWLDSTDPKREIQAHPDRSPPATGVPDPRYLRYEIGVLHARFKPFDGDYRGAIARIDGLVERLRAHPEVYAVEVVDYPLDLRSAGSVVGSASPLAAIPEAAFALRVVRGVPASAPSG
jgi:hypothetical protein